MLYIVSTPIGNLSDITFRAVEALKACDLILCEDTRHSLKLLQHYSIEKPLKSYHQFNEEKATTALLPLLQEGKTVCLISDAGTPLISDPGFPLIQMCIREKIPYSPLPGPCALIDALVGSGLPANKFQFIGFLPQKRTDLAASIADMACYDGTSICYESPHRILDSITLMNEIIPERKACLARELTKRFETFIQGTVHEIALTCEKETPKGEIVLLLAPNTVSIAQLYPSALELAEKLVVVFQIPKKEAIKIAAELCGENKRALYTKNRLLN